MSQPSPQFLSGKVINEAVWKVLRSTASAQAMVAGAGQGDKDALLRYSKFSAEWWQHRKRRWTAGTCAWLATAVPMFASFGHLDKPVKGMLLLGWFVIGGAAAGIGYSLENQAMSVREMEMLAEQSELDTVQRQYVVALARLYRSSFTPEFRAELRDQLNRLMVEYDRLKLQHGGIEAMLGESELGDSIRGDIERIEHRIAQSVDESARATYRESLEIAQKRLRKFEQGAPLLERTEGQMELVAQSLAAFSESMSHVVQTDRNSLDGAVDGLRSRLMSVREHTEAISQAFDDLQILRQ
jgi:hypothetical protein